LRRGPVGDRGSELVFPEGAISIAWIMHERPPAFMHNPGRAAEKRTNREADPRKGRWRQSSRAKCEPLPTSSSVKGGEAPPSFPRKRRSLTTRLDGSIIYAVRGGVVPAEGEALPESPEVQNRPVWRMMLAVLLVATLSLIFARPLNINHDCALGLQEARLLLEEKVPYVDFVEINPPFFGYLHVIPVLIADFIGVHVATTFLVMVWVFSLICILVTRRLLLKAFDESEAVQAELVALAFAALCLFLLQRREYGEREHLFVLGYAPFLALRFRRWEKETLHPGLAVSLGLLAGLVICLKPHCLAVALAPELYWLATHRRAKPLFQPEVFSPLLVGFAYALHFFLLPAEARASFFGRWFPFIVERYDVYNCPLGWMMRSKVVWLALFAFGLTFALRAQRNEKGWRLTRAFACMALAGVLTFLLQHKGWFYHCIPCLAASVATLSLASWWHVRTLRFLDEEDGSAAFRILIPRVFLKRALAVLLAATAIACVYLGARSNGPEHLERLQEKSPLIRAICEMSSEDDAVLLISASVLPAYPYLIVTNRRPASRYLWFFPIPLLYRDVQSQDEDFTYRSPDEAPEEELCFLQELAEDIQRFSPRLVFIDLHDCSRACPLGFSINDYLVQTGRVEQALVDYRKSDDVQDMAVYALENAESE
jgi:hypothetical protein